MQSIEEVAAELAERDSIPTAGGEEELILEATRLPAGDESVVAGEEIVWKATHEIGSYVVQERSFVNGLRYWVEADGKRRRPTASNPLRPVSRKNLTAEPLALNRVTMSLLMTAYFTQYGETEVGTVMEDQFGNVAEKLDRDHVLLSVWDRPAGTHVRYLVEIPETFSVNAARTR